MTVITVRRRERGMQHWRLGERLRGIAVMVSPSSNPLDKKGALKTQVLDMNLLFPNFCLKICCSGPTR